MTSADTPLVTQLERYADVIVRVGVNLQRGQGLQLQAPIDAALLVRAVAASAYRAGAPLVSVLWSDPELDRIRLQEAPEASFDLFEDWRVAARRDLVERGDASVSLRSPDPALLRDQDPARVVALDRVRRERMREVSARILNDEVPWCVAGAASPGWARSVFPDAGEDGVERLWRAIFRAVRVDLPDPVAAWRSHAEGLKGRARTLNGRRFRELHFRGPGTDLRVGLPELHVWNGGGSSTRGGQSFVPNLPTEEVFSAPHRERVDGVVTSSRPLNHGGTVIEDFTLTFERGRVVRAEARRGESALRGILDSDEGARRLGEVALVPESSPIARSGLLFSNTLYDENAASHLALGRSYRSCVEGGPTMSAEAASAAGLNDSVTHVDFMIGSAEVDVDGVHADGGREAVMRAGEWSA